MIRTIFALSAALIATPALAEDTVTRTVPVAYDALAAGQNEQAVAEIMAARGLRADDPSRLINLGSAYVRLGRVNEAIKMFEAAAHSPVRYDLQLADGRFMDSREAARLALSRLNARVAAR